MVKLSNPVFLKREGGVDFIPQGTLLKILELITLLHKRKLTIEEIAKMGEVSIRTAYRYIAIIDILNIGLTKEHWPRIYHIENKNCPFCGHKQPTTTTDGTDAN